LPWVASAAQRPAPSNPAVLSSIGVPVTVAGADPEPVLVTKVTTPPPSKAALFPDTAPIPEPLNGLLGLSVRGAVAGPRCVTLLHKPPPTWEATLEARKLMLLGLNVVEADPEPVPVTRA